MARRTGIVAVALFLIQICQTLQAYEVKLKQALADARDADKITSDQYTQAITFLDSAMAICLVFRLASGY